MFGVLAPPFVLDLETASILLGPREPRCGVTAAAEASHTPRPSAHPNTTSLSFDHLLEDHHSFIAQAGACDAQIGAPTSENHLDLGQEIFNVE
jgi:hypothetical protein